MIGKEAYPNLLGEFSTHYPASNVNRTTNLKLAAKKIKLILKKSLILEEN